MACGTDPLLCPGLIAAHKESETYISQRPNTDSLCRTQGTRPYEQLTGFL